MHVVIVISNTHLLCKNWLKSIFLMRSCINNALWDFAWFLCRCRCWWVIFDVRYWKWAALNFFLQTILHVCLICFCMSISHIIISVRWCSISDRDNSQRVLTNCFCMKITIMQLKSLQSHYINRCIICQTQS